MDVLLLSIIPSRWTYEEEERKKKKKINIDIIVRNRFDTTLHMHFRDTWHWL